MGGWGGVGLLALQRRGTQGWGWGPLLCLQGPGLQAVSLGEPPGLVGFSCWPCGWVGGGGAVLCGGTLRRCGARDGVPRLSTVLCSSPEGLATSVAARGRAKAFLKPRLAV